MQLSKSQTLLRRAIGSSGHRWLLPFLASDSTSAAPHCLSCALHSQGVVASQGLHPSWGPRQRSSWPQPQMQEMVQLSQCWREWLPRQSNSKMFLLPGLRTWAVLYGQANLALKDNVLRGWIGKRDLNLCFFIEFCEYAVVRWNLFSLTSACFCVRQVEIIYSYHENELWSMVTQKEES